MSSGSEFSVGRHEDLWLCACNSSLGPVKCEVMYSHQVVTVCQMSVMPMSTDPSSFFPSDLIV